MQPSDTSVDIEPKPIDSVRVVLWSNMSPGKFLVVVEADDLGNWKLPGGRFASDTETPREAASREIAEEVGLDLHFGEPIELLNDDNISKRYIFSAEVAPDAIVLSDDETDSERVVEIRWVTQRETEASEWKNKGHILSATKISTS